MIRLNDAIQDEGLREVLQALKNVAFSDGAWAEGTNDHTIKSTATTTFLVDGVFCSKGATDNIAPTVCASQAANKRCRYLVSLNSSGTVTVTKGTEVTSLTTGALTTLAWDGVEKKLRDSASSLTFENKDKIYVSGFTSNENNGWFTIEEVAKDGSWVKVVENGMVSEVEGDSVTVLRESSLPDCPAKQTPVCIITVTTGTTAFTVGTDDITDDIGTGSVAFTEIGSMPTEFI
jgi:hypothetical protein